eukprot:8794135-Lingulodinium_polyedra.AAC.1
MVDQLKKHFQRQAVSGVPREEPVDPAKVLSSRMVLSQKQGGYKARWTIGGNQDREAGLWETFSPTAMSLGHIMVLQLAVLLHWTLFTADVSA